MTLDDMYGSARIVVSSEELGEWKRRSSSREIVSAYGARWYVVGWRYDSQHDWAIVELTQLIEATG